MISKFLDQVRARVLELQEKNIKTIFTIASTSKIELEPYLTPLRATDQFCYSGCVIFSQHILDPLIEVLDGKVDLILVDSEKKIPLNVRTPSIGNPDSTNTVGFVETGNLSKLCFQKISQSKVVEFKPNDLTVNATWSFLSQRLQFLSGKKVAILGAGNIGSKLALKMVESGADVHLFRRNLYKGHQIAHALNLIKSENTVATVQFHENILQACFSADVLIGATSGYPIIEENIIQCVNQQCLLVDLGKNNISAKALDSAIKQGLEVYRADVAPAIEGFIYEVIRVQNILDGSYGKRDLGSFSLVAGGWFGKDGSLIVDHLYRPKYLIGVSNGNGSLKNELSAQDESRVEKFKEKFGIKSR